MTTNTKLTPEQRVRLEHANAAWEVRHYLLKHCPQDAWARRLARSMESVVDLLWPLPTEASPASQAARAKERIARKSKKAVR